MMKSFISCLFLLLAGITHLGAQELSGVWVGNFSKNLLMAQPEKVVVEIFLHNDSLITGASHLYYRKNQYEHYTLIGSYNKNDSTFFIREDSTLGLKLGSWVSNCLGNYSTKLTITDNSLQLKGKWRPNVKEFLGCPTVNVFLEKTMPSKHTPLANKVKDKNLDRISEIQSLIEIPVAEKDSIKIALSDNLKIDGDIISVYLNDTIVLHQQLLSATPVVFYVSLKKGEPICKIKMAAESMGSEPPCTALMQVTTSTGKQYEVDLSSNFGKNAIVELFLKE